MAMFDVGNLSGRRKKGLPAPKTSGTGVGGLGPLPSIVVGKSGLVGPSPRQPAVRPTKRPRRRGFGSK